MLHRVLFHRVPFGKIRIAKDVRQLSAALLLAIRDANMQKVFLCNASFFSNQSLAYAQAMASNRNAQFPSFDARSNDI